MAFNNYPTATAQSNGSNGGGQPRPLGQPPFHSQQPTPTPSSFQQPQRPQGDRDFGRGPASNQPLYSPHSSVHGTFPPAQSSAPFSHHMRQSSPDQGPRRSVEVFDLRDENLTEAGARNKLSTLIAIRITKSSDPYDEDEEGNPVPPTWKKAIHTPQVDISQEEATRKVRELNDEGKVADKKENLPSDVQAQIERAQESLEYREIDSRYVYTLAQLDTKIRRVDRSSDRYESRDRRTKDKKKHKHSSKSSKTKKELVWVVAYFKRAPGRHEQCMRMFEDQEIGKQRRESSPQRHSPINGPSQHPLQQQGQYAPSQSQILPPQAQGQNQNQTRQPVGPNVRPTVPRLPIPNSQAPQPSIQGGQAPASSNNPTRPINLGQPGIRPFEKHDKKDNREPSKPRRKASVGSRSSQSSSSSDSSSESNSDSEPSTPASSSISGHRSNRAKHRSQTKYHQHRDKAQNYGIDVSQRHNKRDQRYSASLEAQSPSPLGLSPTSPSHFDYVREAERKAYREGVRDAQEMAAMTAVAAQTPRVIQEAPIVRMLPYQSRLAPYEEDVDRLDDAMGRTRLEDDGYRARLPTREFADPYAALPSRRPLEEYPDEVLVSRSGDDNWRRQKAPRYVARQQFVGRDSGAGGQYQQMYPEEPRRNSGFAGYHR